MMIFDSIVRTKLARIVGQLAAEASGYDDLMQEALIHLWQQELDKPGQTQSWYLQSCRFHLLTYLSRGRSVDSLKRRRDRSAMTEVSEAVDFATTRREEAESPLGSVCALDLIESLSKRISPVEQIILACLAEGIGLMEIAKKLGISHQAVSKYRQRLAALALKLGVSPMPKPANDSNGLSVRKDDAQRTSGSSM
jgi:RNA polymerase sigma factor (sigma-70 family)